MAPGARPSPVLLSASSDEPSGSGRMSRRHERAAWMKAASQSTGAGNNWRQRCSRAPERPAPATI